MIRRKRPACISPVHCPAPGGKKLVSAHGKNLTGFGSPQTPASALKMRICNKQRRVECLITLSNAYWGLIPTLFIVSVLVFLFIINAAIRRGQIAGPEADAQVIELVRQQLGLDQPLYHQFWHCQQCAVRGILACRWCRASSGCR